MQSHDHPNRYRNDIAQLVSGHGLVGEISLLVHRVVVGKRSNNIFGRICDNSNLEMLGCRRVEKDYMWLVFKVAN